MFHQEVKEILEWRKIEKELRIWAWEWLGVVKWESADGRKLKQEGVDR